MKNYSYAIIADASCDLSDELRARFEVDGYLKGCMSTPDADDIEAQLNLSDAELDAFYASLKANKKGYKTSAISVDETISYFESFLQQGKDIIAISLTGKLSAVYSIMLHAKKIVCEKYPARKVFVIDSMKYSAAVGLLTLKACELRAEGYTIEKNAEALEQHRKEIHHMGAIDDLFWVASKGRISHAKAVFGSVAGIKPMGDFDSEGMVTVLAKVSGYDKAFKTTAEYIKRTIVSANEQRILVAHSARRKQTEKLAELIREHVKPKEVIVCNIYPFSGINAGPGVIAAFYFGTEITDLKLEKEIIDDIISKS